MPPEIRGHTLRMAFGERRLHMDLSYSHRSGPSSVDQPTAAKSWHWRSSVCHRLPLDYAPKLEGPMTEGGPDGPWADSWRHSEAEDCLVRSENVPSKFHIGIMGWLLSCRQSYIEAIDVLYSTNTISMAGEAMLCHLPQLLLPQRLARITPLEITWPLKTRDVGESFWLVEEDHLKSILQTLSTDFPGLRRLHLSLEDSHLFIFHKMPECVPPILRTLDQFAQWMVTLSECAIALPDELFNNTFEEASMVIDETSGRSIESYHQVWRSLDGEMNVIRLPFVDSYPAPPYDLSESSAQYPGYWIVHGSYQLTIYSSPPRQCACTWDGQSEFGSVADLEFDEEITEMMGEEVSLFDSDM
ncbi:hypothetical protein B0T10DRAFT_607683 [Thelonectria olida]|uniref:DUF7730 domain-containing protein n=1 Tax=Thelonectria olida TaxID=1576542 RepID=A0A9P9ANE6_9HYPO|nr:hypothetical protein B0T10DRAFT_607683 [Thelonectria olida]